MILIGDSESPGLKYESKRLWCIVHYAPEKDEWFISVPDGWEERCKIAEFIPKNISFLSYPENIVKAMEYDKVIYHNGIMHDFALYKKLYPPLPNLTQQAEDTFILSSLFNPDRSGGHSLEAWGEKLGIPKRKHEDWSCFSLDMLHRCIQDVKLGYAVYKELERERGSWNWDTSIRLEYAIARLQAQQEMNGVDFNKRDAIDLWIKIVKEIQQIDKKLLAELPKRIIDCKPVNKPFLQSGGYSKMTTDYFSEKELKKVNVKAPFTRISYEEINLNSSDQIKTYLLSQGWIPTTWNYQKRKGSKQFEYGEDGKKIPTSPKLTEDSYSTIKGELPNLIARRNILKHRKGLIYSFSTQQKRPIGWLTNIRDDGRIEAKAIPQACNTGRYQHSVIVNVPKASKKVVYGEELRSLFHVPNDWDMVGVDAKALEARTEAHNCFPFPGGEAYAHELIDGDIHAANAILFGTDRDGAKSPKYALRLAHVKSCELREHPIN